MEDLSSFTGRDETLPMDTIAAVQLLELFRDPDRDVDRIVEFISGNPLLTAETLKRCNNAVYRGSERITDVFEAVSRLGFYELYDIVAHATGYLARLRFIRIRRPAAKQFGMQRGNSS